MDKQRLLSIEPAFNGPIRRKLYPLVGRPLEQLLSLPAINHIYSSVTRKDSIKDFLDNLLEVMEIQYDIPEMEFQRIPHDGPVIVVANHPFGGIEGIILGSMLLCVRPDVRIFANYFLQNIPELDDIMIYVDPFGRESSARRNITPLKEAMGLLRKGGMLGIFPAGEVSHMHITKRRIQDPLWNPIVARLVHKAKCQVLPVFFQGNNGPLFQMLGMVHPRLRTAMLPRELVNKSRKTISVSVGNLIPYSKLEKMRRDEDLMEYLRLRTYILRNRGPQQQDRRRFLRLPRRGNAAPPTHPDRPMEEIAEGPGLEAIKAEIARLPEDALLCSSGEFKVYCASATLIPNCIQEIGRLREITFRKVGEGTGRSFDLDRFDEYYHHLFVWNEQHQHIAGAYRIGRSDEILKAHGIEGLYTSTLFTFKPELFKRMGNALEMGRSFVRPECQKNYGPLLLLWKGITQYVIKNKQYRCLFGPVSISSDYSVASRDLLVRALKKYNSLSSLSKLVRAKTPPKLKTLKRYEFKQMQAIFNNIDDITSLIPEFETDQKGIPVLLKQYLKLGGKVLAFNVDPDFNNALDGLLLVDLTQTDRRILNHYFGKTEAEAFLAFHGQSTEQQETTSS